MLTQEKNVSTTGSLPAGGDEWKAKLIAEQEKESENSSSTTAAAALSFF